MRDALDTFLFYSFIGKGIVIVAGGLMVWAGFTLLLKRKAGDRPTTDLEINAAEGTISLRGAVPGVILIVLGAVLILFAYRKPVTFEYKDSSGAVLTGTGGPEMSLRHLPPLLDSMVRGAAASPDGLTLMDDEGSGAYLPLDLLTRAEQAEAACERMLEVELAAGDPETAAGESLVPASVYFFPALLDTLVRGSSASTTGWLTTGPELGGEPAAVRARATHVLWACEQIVTSDQHGRPVSLEERVRAEGVR